MSEPKLKTLKLKNVTADAGVQPRDGLHGGTVKEYAGAMKAGAVFPPCRVFRSVGGTLWLSRGFHRFAAAEKAGLTELEFEVLAGERSDALLDAAKDNATHGRPRTNKDKLRSVMLLLGEFADWSNRDIADAACVSHAFVNKVKAKIQADALETVSSAEVGTSPAVADPKARVERIKQDFSLVMTLARQLRAQLHRLLEDGRAATYLRRAFRADGAPLFAERPLVSRGGTQEGGWGCPALDELLAQVERRQVEAVCPRCGGPGCGECEHTGFVPKMLGEFRGDSWEAPI